VKAEFSDIYEDQVWGVYGFFAYRLPSRSDAEDLTQLTFERALRAWDRYDERRGSVRTWLLAIARNALTDYHRRDRSRQIRSLSEGGIKETEMPTVPGPDHGDFGPDAELARALARLTEREREVIALRFGGDLTGPEISKLLGLTVANVQQISSRALRSLRNQLDPEDVDRPARSVHRPKL
jgi:RNA polymerase sigma factor (sigma-70 family)